MHLNMIAIAIAIAVLIRLVSNPSATKKSGLTLHLPPRPTPQTLSWQSRWHRSLVAFVVPPLLLLTTAVAVITMGMGIGHHHWEGQVSYGIALGFMAIAVLKWTHLYWLSLQSQHRLKHHPISTIQAGHRGRIMDVPAVFSAQVGLWPSELVVSRGLLTHLDNEHLAAVLAHEAGHGHYQDTFWFFWLGGLRRLTSWLPNTEALWQELLLLREIRADRWAARSVDTLVLAESLMSVITAPLMAQESICAGFSCAAPQSRLAQRIDALLEADLADLPAENGISSFRILPWQWAAIAFALTPLLTIPFHY